MIARHRGDDMREHTHWRPGACAVAATAPPDTDLETELDELREDEPSELDPREAAGCTAAI